MKVITDLTNADIGACVASIGNFDGIHLGHQNIIHQITNYATNNRLASTVIVFEPQPQEFFHGDNAPARLTNLTEKLFYLEQLHIEQVVVLAFDEALQQLSANDFIQKILLDALHVKHLIVGDDFKFGADRQGDFALLKANKNFTVENTQTVEVDNSRVSSSRIRSALANSHFDVVQKLLGRCYSMRGQVIKGDQNGRKIGVPTANIAPDRQVLPLTGVFAVNIHGLDKIYHGVANLGIRPTVGGLCQLLETHIFDFEQDIYAKHLNIEFYLKIRDEQKFENFDALRQKIQHDIQQAKAFFCD